MHVQTAQLTNVRPALCKGEGPNSYIDPLCQLAPAVNGWGFFRPREKRVSHICVWRYVRPFIRNNNYSVYDCNRIGGFARDDSLPQHLAAASQADHPMKEPFQGPHTRRKIVFGRCCKANVS